MDGLQELTLVGVSHRTAPVAVREGCAVGPDELQARLEALVSEDTVAEAAVLSTCNRTEAILIARPGTDAAGSARRVLFSDTAADHLFVHRGVHAVMHLFRVASGLESLVLGESEILAQTKRAYETAVAAGTAKKVLDPLLRQALQVGKRVRRETELGQGTLSVARVAVDVAQHAYGDLANNRAMIVGAGETGRLVARHLASAGVGVIDFANRTLERAVEAAAEFGGEAIGLEDLGQRAPKADVIVVCVDGDGGLLSPDSLDNRLLGRRDQPMIVIDLSVPRAVDPSLGEHRSVLLYDLDDLGPIVERNRQGRDDASAATAEIVVAEVHKFLALRTYAAFSPTIAELRRKFELAREEILERFARGDADQREIELAHALEKRLLDLALETLKEGARRSRSEEAIDREYQRFLRLD